MKKKIKSLFVLPVILMVIGFCSGCASTTQYAPFPDQRKQIDDPTKARIYVVRPTSMGGAISMKVHDGTTFIGKTGPKGYLCWERDPGPMTLIGKAENTAKATIDVKPNTIYFFQQHVRMGWLFARNKLSKLPGDEGLKKLEKCKPPELTE